MADAVELYLDPGSERRLRRLWDALEAAGVPTLRDFTHRRHRPHVSYTVFHRLDRSVATEALTGLAAAGGPYRLELTHVGVFPGGVLFLGVAVSAELLRRHLAVHDALDGLGRGPWEHYWPGNWVPHCTLSMRVPMALMSRAVPICHDVLPMSVVAETSGIVDTRTGHIAPLPGVP